MAKDKLIPNTALNLKKREIDCDYTEFWSCQHLQFIFSYTYLPPNGRYIWPYSYGWAIPKSYGG